MGGGCPRCPPSGVSTSQARRRHVGRHLSLCRRGGLAVWLPSSPFLPCVRTPGAPPAGACMARASYGHGRVVRPAPSLRCLPTLPLCPRGGGGGGAVRPSLPSSPTLGGAVVCGGGGCLVVIPSLHACRRHDASTAQAPGAAPCPPAGGGASFVAPVVAVPTLCPHLSWSPRWGLHGTCSLRARSCGPSRTRSPLPPHPGVLFLRGGRFCPPLPASPIYWGGGGVVGGGGALVVFPPQHARRRHDASMAQARGAAFVPLQGQGLAVCHRSLPPLPCVRTPGGAEVCLGGFGLVWVKACAGRPGPWSALAFVPTRLGWANRSCPVPRPAGLLTAPVPRGGIHGREMPPCLCVWRARGRTAGRACWWRSQGMTGHTAAPRLALPAGAGAAPVFLVSPAAACSGVPAVRVVVGCEPGSATTGPRLLVVEARRGGGGVWGVV